MIGGKRAIRFLLAFAVAATGSAALVRAQEVTGSHIKRKEAGSTGRYARPGAGNSRAEFNAFARCFAENFDVKSRDVLRFAYGEKEQSEAVGRLLKLAEYNSGDCFAAYEIRAHGPATSYAGAFAEFFVVHRFGASRLNQLGDQAWRDSRTPPRNAYERFGACVVDASAPAVFALAESVPGSAAENAAISRIAPSLSPCVLSGQQVSFDRSSLRSILSVALYRSLSDYNAFSRGDR